MQSVWIDYMQFLKSFWPGKMITFVIPATLEEEINLDSGMRPA
jgi:hypothetical protein